MVESTNSTATEATKPQKKAEEKQPPNTYSNSPLNRPDAGLQALPTYDVLIKLGIHHPQDILPLWVQHSQPEESKTVSEEASVRRMMTLLRFIRAARFKKMLECTNDKLCLTEKYRGMLKATSSDCLPLEILYSDLQKIILAAEPSLAREAISVLQTAGCSEPLAPFEIPLAAAFLKKSMQTTFPDHRQKYMKVISQFFIRLRTVFAKDIKRYKPGGDLTDEQLAELWKPLEPLAAFLKDIIDHAQGNLYLEKPIEGAFPLLDILRLILDLFGGVSWYLNKAKTFEPVNFLAKAKLLQSPSLFFFFVNSLKSSWTAVRTSSLELLAKYSGDYELFHSSEFVNDMLVPTAFDFLNDPRAMMAEASALMLKLALTKCIQTVDLQAICTPENCGELSFAKNEMFEPEDDKRLIMCWLLLCVTKERLKTFRSSLITQGKTSRLIHGLLSFFKHLFTDLQIGPKEALGEAAFNKWKAFYHALLATCLEISKDCAVLLSNNRLTEEGEALVDCRGHPIAQVQEELAQVPGTSGDE